LDARDTGTGIIFIPSLISNASIVGLPATMDNLNNIRIIFLP